MKQQKRKATRKRALTTDAAEIYDTLRDLLNLAAERDPRVVCAWGVTITECHALEHLARTGPCTLNEVAASLRLDKSTTSRTVKNLVRKKLVGRDVHPQDGRSVHLALTAKGRDLAAAVAKANRDSYARILRRVPAEERASLLRALTQIATLVAGLDPRPPS